MSRPVLLLARRALPLVGATLTAAAVGWWWLSFREVYAADYLSLRETLACSIADTDICRLATSLCRAKHALSLAAYHSASLWAGLAVLLASLVAGPAHPPIADVDGRRPRQAWRP